MKNHDIHYFIELTRYSYVDTKPFLENELFQKGLCVREENNIIFKFVGVIFVGNTIIIVFPKGYSPSNNPYILQQHTRLLIDVFLRYEEEKSTYKEENQLLTSNFGNAKNIKSMMWLIEDYFENGIFRKQEHFYSINSSHNINWSRTIKSQSPTIINDQPFYLNLITKKVSVNLQNAITLIHQYIIQECIAQLGWLFSCEPLEEEFEVPFDDEHSLHILDLAIQQSFSDRDILLFSHLKTFILGSNNNDEDLISLFVTQYFHWIWEHICLSLFSKNNQEILSPPNPYWLVGTKKAKTSQIPDIMFSYKGTIYILDAKYYQVDAAPYKLPGWKDIVKQLFYRYTMMNKREYRDYNIVNIFLFPKDKDKDISYLGYAGVEDQNDLGEIEAFLVSITKAMELYVSRRNGSLQRVLITKYQESKHLKSTN